MSDITWAELTEFEQGHLKSFNNDPHAVSARRSSQSLETKGLIKWGWETGYVLTDAGRAVLAQADAKPDSGATGAKNAHVEAGEFLPPITRHDDETWCEKGYNNGYEAAAKIAREQYNLANYWADKNAELMTELASAKAEAGRLRTAACKAEELRQIWLKKSEITNAAYDVLQASDRPYDARTKEYKAHDTLSKESQRALWSFQDAIRNIGNSVWQSYLADQRKQAAALQAGTEGG